MKKSEIEQLSEYLLKGCMLLYDEVSENHGCKAMIVLSGKTSKGQYDVKIIFEPKEGESDENE